MKNFPVIKSIRTFDDVKKALDNLRAYFTALPISIANVEITQPLVQARLTIGDAKELKVNETWELNDIKGGVINQQLDTTQFVEVVIRGVKTKLAVLQ